MLSAVGLTIAIVVVYRFLAAKNRAIQEIDSRPGPETCGKDADTPFRDSSIELRKTVCADGICCCSEHKPYAEVSDEALPLKFFVKGPGLRLSWSVCKHLDLSSSLENGRLVLEFRCGQYLSRPSGCREYPEVTRDGSSLCKYNEYLAPYDAYPFGHWVAYYGFPTNKEGIEQVFPMINNDAVLNILQQDPWKLTVCEDDREYILIPVPKCLAVLYTSPVHPPVTTLSQVLETWPEAMTVKYQTIYGPYWRHVLAEDLRRSR